MEGYFKVHRKILESSVFAHPLALKIWIWCLAKVSFKERHIPVKIGKGNTIVTIKPGQFLFGRFKAEEELNIDGSTIYRWMQKFANSEDPMIKIESNNQYSIITLCNWEEYQNGNDTERTTNEQQKNSKRTAKEQPTNTNNNVNNVNNVKKEKERKKTIPPLLEWVVAYCKERENIVDTNQFFDFYESKGWKIGKEIMKDWQAAVRNWEKRSENSRKKEDRIKNVNDYYK